jgi:4-amino-4-deoxy-L-arabinose transferase-like glycosyltransferase
VETGNYIDIRFQDDVRYKKPVGIYWLQAGVVTAAEALGLPRARTTIWLYRIPSLAGAIGAVLLTYWTALAFTSRRYAWLAGLMLASSIVLGVEARLAKTDAMLLLTVVAAMGALARLYLAPVTALPSTRSWTLPAIFWTALAAGVLLKGPLIGLFVGLAVATLVIVDRKWRWLIGLRPLTGIAWFGLLVLPWFIAILGIAGESFFVESVGRDMLAKVVSSQEAHGAPPGYYLLLFWLTFWPAAPLALLSAPGVFAQRKQPAERFLLAWLVPAWIALEAVVTKLPHYVLPLYPAIAILIACTLSRGVLSRNLWFRRGTLGWPLFATIIPLTAIAGLMMLRGQLGLAAWPFAAGAMIFGFLAWRFFDSDGADRSFLRASFALVLIAIGVYGIIMPSLRPLFPSATLARTLRHVDCPDPHFAAAGYHEPSLVFLLGTATRLTDGAGAADFLRQGPCRFALVEARQERAFVQRAQALGLRYAAGMKVDAVNINGGRALAIAIYRSEPAP